MKEERGKRKFCGFLEDACSNEIKQCKPKFLFGDIVVINEFHIGVILKTWNKNMSGIYEYEVYNRMSNKIETYLEKDIERYRVRHKYLSEEELEYQNKSTTPAYRSGGL